VLQFIFHKGDQMKLTNQGNLPLSVAVWLAEDTYDYDPSGISATGLLKSVRQIVLGDRVVSKQRAVDVSSYIPSSFGTAVHDAINNAWVNSYKNSMAKLGYPKSVIDPEAIASTPNI
jgi:hypothetical protein